MSRCFPFPPPGYLRKSDALIDDSIKIRLDLEKPDKDRKDKKEKEQKKREKEERKKEKREKKEKRKRDKEYEQKVSTSQSSVGIKFKFNDDIKEPKDNGKLLEGDDCENEQLERSGITEEHDQPVSSPQEPCTSDSSQSSTRKRSKLLPSQDHGPAIRIRLPLRKHQEPEVSKQGFELGSSSRSVGIPHSGCQEIRKIECPLQGITKNQSTNRFHGHSTSEVCKPLKNAVHGNSASKVSKSLQNLVSVDAKPANETVDDESQRIESLYKSLLKIQPVTYDGLDLLDQDWLFAEAKPVSKKQKTSALLCSKSLWPKAQYMADVDIYALPYTVPF